MHIRRLLCLTRNGNDLLPVMDPVKTSAGFGETLHSSMCFPEVNISHSHDMFLVRISGPAHRN